MIPAIVSRAKWFAFFSMMLLFKSLSGQSIVRHSGFNYGPIIIGHDRIGKLPIYVLARAEGTDSIGQKFIGALDILESLKLIDPAFEIHEIQVRTNKGICAASSLHFGKFVLSPGKRMDPHYIAVDTAGIDTICRERRDRLKLPSCKPVVDSMLRRTTLVSIASSDAFFRLILKDSAVIRFLEPQPKFTVGFQSGINSSLVFVPNRVLSSDASAVLEEQGKYQSNATTRLSFDCSARIAPRWYCSAYYGRSIVQFSQKLEPFTYANNQVETWTHVEYNEKISYTEIGLPIKHFFQPIGRGPASIFKSDTWEKAQWYLVPVAFAGPTLNLSPKYSANLRQFDSGGAGGTVLDSIEPHHYRKMPAIGMVLGAGLNLMHGISCFSINASFHPALTWVHYENPADRTIRNLGYHAYYVESDWLLSNLYVSAGYSFLLGNIQKTKTNYGK